MSPTANKAITDIFLEGDTLRSRIISLVAMVAAIALIASAPALADHTDPRQQLSPTEESPQEQGVANGEGTWEFLRNFPPNPGTDLEFFRKARRTFVGSGTLGQGDEGHVGQRFIKLVGKSGKVNIKWIADHGIFADTGMGSGKYEEAVLTLAR